MKGKMMRSSKSILFRFAIVLVASGVIASQFIRQTAAAATATTLLPVADAYVDSGNPSTNFGTGTTIRVDGSPVANSYLRFKVTGTSKISSARLRIYST